MSAGQNKNAKLEEAGGEWELQPFGQILKEPVRNGIYKPKEFHGRGVKIVNMGELFAYPRLHSVPMKRVFLSDSEKKRFMLSTGDLLFARRSLVAEGAGKCSIVLELDEPATYESSIIRARPDNNKIESLFLYYFFNSVFGLHCLDTIRRQVAVAGITGNDLARLEIPIPPLEEQRAIAHILGTLDDKIELNRRTNETLEAMAQALFKFWFVDFGPVRAKMEGRWRRGQSLPGLPAHLFDLFPDRLVDSELGEIPEGWEVGKLGNIMVQNHDHINPLDTPDALFKLFSIPSFDEGQQPKYQFGKNIKSIKTLVPIGSILLSKLNPEIKRVWLVDINEHETAICSTEFLVLEPRCPFWRIFSYCFLLSSLFQKYIKTLITGTSNSHQRAQSDKILTSPVIIPQKSIVEKYENYASFLLLQKLGYHSESNTLITLRDTLLPKLISGELLVKDAEKIIGRIM